MNFAEHAKESELPASTQAACQVLDDIIRNLQETSAEGADYFDLMVGAFAGELRIEQNDHLKNFFVIIPPLMLAYLLRGICIHNNAPQFAPDFGSKFCATHSLEQVRGPHAVGEGPDG